MGKEKKDPTISMLLYGPAGSGKSIFASTFPKPLVFDFDGGHKIYESQELFPDAKYVRGAKSLEYFQKAVEQIEDSTFEYDTLVIDSLTNLENNAISRFKGYNTGSLAETLYTKRGKKLNYDDWGSVSGSSIALLNKLRDYPVNVVVITQLATTYDDGKEKYKPELIGKGQNESLHFPDYVIYMDKIMGEKGIERVAYLNSSDDDKFVAKSRGVKEVTINQPNYEKLITMVKANKLDLSY